MEVVRKSAAETEVEFIAEQRVPVRAADQLARCRSERERRGNQPLITPAVVFTLLCAFILSLESSGWTSPPTNTTTTTTSLPFRSCRCRTTKLSPPTQELTRSPTQRLSPLSHYFNSLSLWQREMEPFCCGCISWPSLMQTPPLRKHSYSASVCKSIGGYCIRALFGPFLLLCSFSYIPWICPYLKCRRLC